MSDKPRTYLAILSIGIDAKSRGKPMIQAFVAAADEALGKPSIPMMHSGLDDFCVVQVTSAHDSVAIFNAIMARLAGKRLEPRQQFLDRLIVVEVVTSNMTADRATLDALARLSKNQPK